MLETAAVAFKTFVANISQIEADAMFAVITPHTTAAHPRSMAIPRPPIASEITIVFALFGELLLSTLGISLAALRTSGGILLLLIGIDMVFARSSGGTSTTEDETQEAAQKKDISVFPLATPLIAGPGAMGAAILLMANAHGEWKTQAVVVACLLAVLLITFVALLGATYIQKILGVTGLHVISRIFGVLLSALAVQFIFDGINQSGLLT